MNTEQHLARINHNIAFSKQAIAEIERDIERRVALGDTDAPTRYAAMLELQRAVLRYSENAAMRPW